MHHYTAYYCEENVWHLCREPRFEGVARWAVFVSNPSRSCALWHQRAAPGPGVPVVWDYHVIMVAMTGAEGGAEVWDLDSLLGMPVELGRYVAETFGMASRLPEVYRSMFRVVPAAVLEATFSSDRAHMRRADGGWAQPPPEWPAIGGCVSPNLMRFVSMAPGFVGEVLDLGGFVGRFLGRTGRGGQPGSI